MLKKQVKFKLLIWEPWPWICVFFLLWFLFLHSQIVYCRSFVREHIFMSWILESMGERIEHFVLYNKAADIGRIGPQWAGHSYSWFKEKFALCKAGTVLMFQLTPNSPTSLTWEHCILGIKGDTGIQSSLPCSLWWTWSTNPIFFRSRYCRQSYCWMEGHVQRM